MPACKTMGKNAVAPKAKAKAKAKAKSQKLKSLSSRAPKKRPSSLPVPAREKARATNGAGKCKAQDIKKTAAASMPSSSTTKTKTKTKKFASGPGIAATSPSPRDSNDATVHVSKFRFQYVNALPVSLLQPGTTYYDRVSLSFPCRQVWGRVLSDPRFSRNGTFVPLCELSAPGLRELAVCVWRNLSGQGRRHLGEQYWRARAQSFENYLKRQALEGGSSGGGGGGRKGEGREVTEAGGPVGAGEAIPDPEPLAENHRDPYLMSCPGRHLLAGNRKASKEEGGGRGTTGGAGEARGPARNYNALRQSQTVSDSPAQFMNSLRCCYAEVAAPKGAMVLLRGNSHNQSGKQVLAEYVRAPEEDLGLWREADADEALAGYVDAASGRRVAYPWRQRLVRVVCQIPRGVVAERGSGGLRKQLNSGKLMRECDARMLRAFAEEHCKVQRSGGSKAEPKKDFAKKGKGAGSAIGKSGAAGPSAEVPDASPKPKRRKAAPSSAVAPGPSPAEQPSHPSYRAFYDLLEQTHFPVGQRANVAGYEGVAYLIFGAHRGARHGPCANQLELTEATRLAYGRLKPEEVMQEEQDEGGDGHAEGGAAQFQDYEQPRNQKYTQQQVEHYRALLEFLLRHFKEVGQHLNNGFVHDPLQDKLIPSDRVFFSSVMVAKNKRTFFHRDGNNKGPSFQVVISDPSRVDSGEFKGGNLLAWPTLEKEEAERRVDELRVFWEARREKRVARKKRMAHVNPVNARWTGEGDQVEINLKTGELLAPVQPGKPDGDAANTLEDLLLERTGGIGLRNLPDESISAARKAVYYGDRPEDEERVEEGEPTHDEDATVVPCVHRYVSFYGRRCYHATEPWAGCANRYCITFFGVNLDGRHRKLRSELEEIGFRPHPEGPAEDEGGEGDED